MESLIGLLKLKIIKGINLESMDTLYSDPYVIITMGSQKVKTRHVSNNCNPEWNEELTLAVYDLGVPIKLMVYDKDLLTADDEMGHATIDIEPYVECLKAGLSDLQNGTVVDKIQPNKENSLADVSHIVWKEGKLLQDMILRLKEVATGEVEIQLEWKHVPGCKGLRPQSLS